MVLVSPHSYGPTNDKSYPALGPMKQRFISDLYVTRLLFEFGTTVYLCMVPATTSYNSIANSKFILNVIIFPDLQPLLKPTQEYELT